MNKIMILLLLATNLVFASPVTDLRQQSKTLNSYSSNFFKVVQNDLNSKKPLHGRQLRLMHEIVSHYINLDEEFVKTIKHAESESLKALLHLDRYESYLLNFEPFYSTTKLRRYLNDEDLSFNIKRNQLNETIMKLLDQSFAKKVSKRVESVLRDQSQSDYTTQIQTHKALDFINNHKKIKALNSLYKKYAKEDQRHDRLVDLTDRISGRFGNTAGGIRWRKGHLLKNKKILDEIRSQLKPLDIITEKTYFALTDKFIPGHFGHNAIWLGTKEELINLGLWNHKSILPFQKEIEQGKSILEVDRSGTHLKRLDIFMNVDEFAILRLKEINFFTARLEEIYTVALSQIGKIYDFNFDVETTDKLVCSELLYQSYTNIHWPTQTYLTRTKLSRVTISPDNIASLALYDESPIDLVYYVAQKKKRQTPYYKDLDGLAKDLEFAKINGEYKRIVKKCKEIDSEPKDCETIYEDLNYTAHSFIPGIGI